MVYFHFPCTKYSIRAALDKICFEYFSFALKSTQSILKWYWLLIKEIPSEMEVALRYTHTVVTVYTVDTVDMVSMLT